MVPMELAVEFIFALACFDPAFKRFFFICIV
jgi:hypothetical protein